MTASPGPRRLPNAAAHALGALLAAAAVLGAAGCKGRMTDAQAGIPDRTPTAEAAREEALQAAIKALQEFRLEDYRARQAKSTPNFAPSRAALSAAISRLRAGAGRPSVPEYEQPLQALEMAKAAADEIAGASASSYGDAQRERGWALFDAASASLVDALAPRVEPAPPAR